MMGRSHALSAAAAWLAGSAVVTVCGADPGIAVYTVGTAVCAGAALWPDLDHRNSVLAHSGGTVTHLIAVALGGFGAWVHRTTKTRADSPDLDGHRTVTHTLAWAAAWGLIAAAVQLWCGPFLAATLVFLASHTGVQAILPPGRRRFRSTGIPVGAGVGVVLAAAAYGLTPGGGWWLGLAVAAGSLMHCLGDALTNSGCPILWPVLVGGRRWYKVVSPLRWRFSTGGPQEELVVMPLSVLVMAGSAVVLLWPWLWPAIDALTGRSSG